jgi:tetratricopeptide (TPR) repeat protein
MNRIIVLLSSLILTVCVAATAHAEMFSDKISEAEALVAKGKELQSVKMYGDTRGYFRQAEQLLRQAIIEDPKDEETHYRAGMVYLEMSDTSEAEKRFKTVKNVLKSEKYSQMIGDYYLKSYKPLLAEGKVNGARSDAEKAVYYNSANREVISKECFVTGKNYFSQGQSGLAERYFDFIGKGSRWGDTAQELYFNAGQEAKETDAKMSLYLKGAKYGQSKDAEIAIELLKMGDESNDDDCFKIYEQAWNINSARNPLTQHAGERLDKIGRSMIGNKTLFDSEVKNRLMLANKMANGIKPYIKNYKKGNYFFDLRKAKKNEFLDHVIHLPKGTKVRFQSLNGKFKLLLSNGQVMSAPRGGVPSIINLDFTIMVVKPVFVVLYVYN